jgi:hypothetical protein
MGTGARPAQPPTGSGADHVKLELVEGEYSVCRLAVGAPVPLRFFSLTRTAEELSVVCFAGEEPEGSRVEGGWRCFRVAGTLDFALTGVLSSIAAPLAAAGVSLFAVSTFDTDYVLVKDLEAAKRALEAEGHELLASPERLL